MGDVPSILFCQIRIIIIPIWLFLVSACNYLLLILFIYANIYTISASLWTVEPVGCFRDSYVEPRPLPELIANFRDTIDRQDINKTVRACATKARDKGYKFFGIQFYTECWSGTGTETTYARDGVSVDCDSGVGKSGAIFVYRFGDHGKYLTREM